LITKYIIISDDYSANCIFALLLFYLCVVVKERTELRCRSFKAPAAGFGKLLQTSGGRDWIRTSDPALIKRML
jgi:hypothetical protein